MKWKIWFDRWDDGVLHKLRNRASINIKCSLHFLKEREEIFYTYFGTWRSVEGWAFHCNTIVCWIVGRNLNGCGFSHYHQAKDGKKLCSMGHNKHLPDGLLACFCMKTLVGFQVWCTLQMFSGVYWVSDGFPCNNYGKGLWESQKNQTLIKLNDCVCCGKTL